MKAKKRRLTEHGPRTATRAGRSVMRDLFSEEEAIELGIYMEIGRASCRERV